MDLQRVGVSIYATEAEVLLTTVCQIGSEAVVIEDFEAPNNAVVFSWGIFDFHIYCALHGRPAMWIDASAVARYLGLPSGLDGGWEFQAAFSAPPLSSLELSR
jgi:hypothetical protein